jgi:UDP-N-acetylglucosamine 4,6-dehydratase
MIKNKRIFITGGAGFLGKNLISRYYDNNEIVVYSRDEAKHYYLKKQFPKLKCVIGDVRNYDLLKKASAFCDIGIFTASLKQIEAVDENIEEGVQIIINGAINSRKIAEENKFQAACFISSDKSRSATTLYGSMKFIAGESFIIDSEQSYTRLSSAIYGNVLNSTGSIIPLIWDAIKNNYKLVLYSEQMTRFMIDIESAMDLVEEGLKVTGYNIIPDLAAFRVKDLFEIYSDVFGLQFTLGTPRISEKLHEIMVSSEEMPRVKKEGSYYYMHYKNIYSNNSNELSSRNKVVSKEELKALLERHNYYKK